MQNPDPKVIEKLNELAEGRFELEVETEQENARFAAAKAKLEAEHALRLQGLSEWKNELDEKIWNEIHQHRAMLIKPGKKSFVTMVASFQLRRIDTRTNVLDKAAIMEIARRIGVVRNIAEPPKASWRFSQKKFFAWLKKNREMEYHFEQFLEDVEASESLTIQPNTNFTVQHESERISPPSTTIKKPT